MKKVILKYEITTLDPNKIFSIDYPKYSNVVKFNEQDGRLYLWIEASEVAYESHDFVLRFTGKEYEEDNTYNYEYIDTVQCGPFVYHLYRVSPANRSYCAPSYLTN